MDLVISVLRKLCPFIDWLDILALKVGVWHVLGTLFRPLGPECGYNGGVSGS